MSMLSDSYNPYGFETTPTTNIYDIPGSDVGPTQASSFSFATSLDDFINPGGVGSTSTQSNDPFGYLGHTPEPEPNPFDYFNNSGNTSVASEPEPNPFDYLNNNSSNTSATPEPNPFDYFNNSSNTSVTSEPEPNPFDYLSNSSNNTSEVNPLDYFANTGNTSVTSEPEPDPFNFLNNTATTSASVFTSAYDATPPTVSTAAFSVPSTLMGASSNAGKSVLRDITNTVVSFNTIKTEPSFLSTVAAPLAAKKSPLLPRATTAVSGGTTTAPVSLTLPSTKSTPTIQGWKASLCSTAFAQFGLPNRPAAHLLVKVQSYFKQNALSSSERDFLKNELLKGLSAELTRIWVQYRVQQSSDSVLIQLLRAYCGSSDRSSSPG
eukprot:TRINITY_DN16333_c0_g1_i2.p1 TRINITY_DN16333_c0_g1~~TRINITY_DN16333_c0_g1_i2.p1  ORF type:complete len:395 (-),score=70.76 TRINITY_DN16333_c0_g1_i2:126-1259(-)